MEPRDLAHFRLIEKLGQGGMGQVYRALDTRLGREVAVKILASSVAADPERLEAFRREARTIAALNHPNIVTIHSIEETEEGPAIQMELVRGRLLAALIPPRGLPLGRFFGLAVPMAEALQVAHAAGVTHGDLKPSNVIVSEEGQVKILDFGLARIRERREEVPPDERTTQPIPVARGITGTIPYMSPEQVQGKTLGPASDLFSLGVILYEMLAGRRPFVGDTPADIIAAILREEARPLREYNPAVPRALERLVEDLLEKRRDRRLAEASELREGLERLRDQGARAAELERSVAVLPFTDLSPEKDQGYFCDGIAEEIIHTLSRIRDLRVASRLSSFQFRAPSVDSREIGRRLRVRTLLEGSVRKGGDRLRITAELLDAHEGHTLWSGRFERDLADLFAVQDEIAGNIAAALQVALGPEDRQAMGRRPTADLAAYDLYLRGRQYFNRYDRRGMQFALQMFSQAINLDPSYARAHAGIADCCSYLYMYGGSDEKHRSVAESASLRALDLDPDLAEARVARGIALSLVGRYNDAEREFESAVELDPDLFEAHYFFARISFAAGKPEQAATLYERAEQVRPDDYQSPLLVAQVYEDLGRAAEATEARRRGVRIAQERLSVQPDDTRAVYMAANGLVALGEHERGLELARRARELEPDEPMVLYNVGCVQALAGALDEALDSLEQAVRSGLTERDWLAHDSNLDPLRELPRFHRMMEKLQQVVDARAKASLS